MSLTLKPTSAESIAMNNRFRKNNESSWPLDTLNQVNRYCDRYDLHLSHILGVQFSYFMTRFDRPNRQPAQRKGLQTPTMAGYLPPSSAPLGCHPSHECLKPRSAAISEAACDARLLVIVCGQWIPPLIADNVLMPPSSANFQNRRRT